MSDGTVLRGSEVFSLKARPRVLLASVVVSVKDELIVVVSVAKVLTASVVAAVVEYCAVLSVKMVVSSPVPSVVVLVEYSDVVEGHVVDSVVSLVNVVKSLRVRRSEEVVVGSKSAVVPSDETVTVNI